MNMKKFFVILEDGIYYVLDSRSYPNEYRSACFVSDSWSECDFYATENSPRDMLHVPGFEI